MGPTAHAPVHPTDYALCGASAMEWNGGRRAQSRRAGMVAFKTLVFTILVPGMIGGLTPWLLAQGASQGSTPQGSSVWLAVGLLLLVVGVGLYLWCAGAFTFIGKGTPAPIDAPKA